MELSNMGKLYKMYFKRSLREDCQSIGFTGPLHFIEHNAPNELMVEHDAKKGVVYVSCCGSASAPAKPVPVDATLAPAKTVPVGTASAPVAEPRMSAEECRAAMDLFLQDKEECARMWRPVALPSYKKQRKT
jgi:hypothetical protein